MGKGESQETRKEEEDEEEEKRGREERWKMKDEIRMRRWRGTEDKGQHTEAWRNCWR